MGSFSSSHDQTTAPAGARARSSGNGEWNVVISTRGDAYRAARAALREFGRVWRTQYFNVLVMRVADIASFLADVGALATINPALVEKIGRIAPAAEVFDFETEPEFEGQLKDIALRWVPALAGRSFHVRVHGRGLRPLVSARTAEQNLDRVLLEALAAARTPGSLDFADPDSVLNVETVGRRAGVSLWTRDDLQKYPFLRAD